jgi:hypothetical protein
MIRVGFKGLERVAGKPNESHSSYFAGDARLPSGYIAIKSVATFSISICYEPRAFS